MTISYASKNPVSDRIAFVDGLARTGKGLTCLFLSHLRGGEHLQYKVSLEHLCYLHHIGGIDAAVAAPFFQFVADEHVYNRIIGRDLNTRLADESSIYKSPDPEEYLRRSTSEGGLEAVRKFNDDGRFPVFDMHNCLASASLVFQALPWARMVHVNRHPVDLAFKWHSRGWGRREAEDPLSFVPIVAHTNGPIPWFAHDWADNYQRMNPMERALESVLHLQQMDEQGYAALDDEKKPQVHRIAFEHLVTDSTAAIAELCRFFNTEPEDGIEVMMKAERCPRVIDPKEREAWFNVIKADVTPDALERLKAAGDVYRKRWGL